MSAYLWAVQIGMPEGLQPSEQQLWLYKWLLAHDAAANTERTALKVEIEELRKIKEKDDSYMVYIDQIEGERDYWKNQAAQGREG